MNLVKDVIDSDCVMITTSFSSFFLKQEFLIKDEHEPDEGGDNVAEPVVSSIGQQVVHLPVVRQSQIQF